MLRIHFLIGLIILHKINFASPKKSILSTEVDNICGTKNIGTNMNLENLLKNLIDSSSIKFKVNYNSKKFSGLFIKFLGNPLTGKLIVFKSRKINYVGLKIKKTNFFLELYE